MLGDIAWRTFSFAYGMFNLVALASIAALRDGAFTQRTSEAEKKDLAIAQEKYWTLSQSPLPGFRHDFFTLKNGVKLHYVVNSKNGEAVATRNVVIFIHGFADSFLLWRNLLKSPTLQSHILIAVDLPGYGGSDGLQKYDPEGVLEAVTAFILGMREKYLQEGAKLVMVSHDWGGIIAARLASEAKELADRWIIASAIIPRHALSNAHTHAASAKQMLRTWLRRPFSLRLLKAALATFSPVLSQFGRSFYIFAITLPWPLATFFITMGNFWLLRGLHHVAAGLRNPDGKFARKLKGQEAAEWMAISSGPGPAQFSSAPQEIAYSESVRRRTKDHGMSEKIRIYREHASLGVWEKSLETIVALSEIPNNPKRSNSGAGLFEDGPPGALKVPTTIVLGMRDPAFERRLVLPGITDYLVRGSQVLTINGAGHWLPHEGLGSKVLEDCTEWALGDEKEPLKNQFDGLPDVKFVVEK